MANPSTMHPLSFPDVASWKNNPRISTGRGTKVNQPRTVLTANQTGIPLPVTRPQATSNKGVVTLQHVVNPADTTHSHVNVWALGYLGNKQPVQVSSGTSPHTFALQPTGESVTLMIQSVGKDGSLLPLPQVPTVSVKL